MVLPNFFIIGAPKTGTTSLYHYLNQHPQIYMSANKEPHFFSYQGDRQPSWGMTDIEEYKSLFEGVSDETAVGEASTWYLYSPTAAQEIKKCVPNAKLIAILRHPIERAYSSFTFRVQMGWENLDTLEQAILAESERIKQNLPWDFHYLNAGLYYEQIERYFNVFGKENIKIFLYEELKSNRNLVCKKMLEFLEVDQSFSFDFSVNHNVSYAPKNKYLNLLFNRSSRLKSNLKKVMPNSFLKKAANYFREKNKASPAVLSSDDKRNLLKYCESDILKTQNLIQKNLSIWLEI